MTIRPTPSGLSGRIDGTRGDRVARTESKTGRTAAPGDAVPRRDDVRISDTARSLQAQAGPEAVPQGELSAERMQAITQRIQQGHYDRPEVIDEVLRQLAPHL